MDPPPALLGFGLLVDLEWYQKYFEGLSSLFDAPLIFSSMIGGVKNGSSIVTSGTCFFNLTPKGTVTEMTWEEYQEKKNEKPKAKKLNPKKRFDNKTYDNV